MFSRPVLFVGVLIAAVAVPYVLLDKNLAKTARGQWNRLLGQAEAKKGDWQQTLALAEQGQLGAALSSAAASGSSATIEEVFRFNVTPQWVAGHWSRVSTVAGDPKQLGMRVALVSGTRPDDVAGSLTYYFDEYHRLQRITFTGLTQDARRLLAAVVTPNGLKSQPTTHAAHYTAGDPQKPTSEVIVRHLPTLVSGSAQARVEVFLDLRRTAVAEQQKRATQEPEPSLLPSSYRRW